MTLYRRFGQGLAILCCIAMFALALANVLDTGFSNIEEETGEVIYFFEYGDFQGALLVALAFLISAVANVCASDFPQIATGISLLPLFLTFYEMAVSDLHFVAAAVVLLLALIHVASNAISWYDMVMVQRAKKAAEAAEAEEKASE